jgi:hypothetical protein
MKYDGCLSLLKEEDIKKIIVTGPERAGTRIAAKMFATDLKYDYVDEIDFKYFRVPLFNKITEQFNNFVAQGPLMAPYLNSLPKDITIIFMIRPIKDILASHKRIYDIKDGWNEKTQNQRMRTAFKNDERINWDGRNSEIKYELWEKIQKPTLSHNIIELEYGSLEGHSLWLAKPKREKFLPHQTTIKGDNNHTL